MMRIETVFGRLLVIGGAAAMAILVGVGCAGLAAVQAGGDQLKGAADQAKGQADAAKGGAAKKDGEDDDGDRLKAKPAPINAPLDDSLNFKKGDKVDWRKVELKGKPGVATIELHWDNEAANIDVDVFDKFGTLIGKNPPRLEGQQVKKILVQIDDPAIYYVRVQAATAKDESIYTLAIKWKGPGGAPKEDAPPPAATPAPVAGPTPTPAPATPATPATPPPPVPLAQDPTKLLAKIVQGFREGSATQLYIDKGTANGVKAGMSGSILEGPEGDKLLEGGTFSINKVLDGKKSVASTNFSKPLGKNNRVVINLK